MKLTIELEKTYDLSSRIVSVRLNMGEGEAGTSFECELLDSDYAIRAALTKRTKSIKGIIGTGVAQPSTQVVTTTTTTAGGAPTSVSSANFVTGVSWKPAGYRLSAKGVPLYPTPPTTQLRQYGIVAECLRQGVTDLSQIAYVLATVKRECGDTYEPIAEFGGSSAWYAPWYGRGLVQLTFEGNYQKYKDLTGFDLIADPEACIRDFGLSAFILVHGSRTGAFTGRKLGDYINGGQRDFYNARRVINGLDHADLIAGDAETWLQALPNLIAGLKGTPPSAATATAAAPAPSLPVRVATPAVTTPGGDPTLVGDKLTFEQNGSVWELVYTGYTAGQNGVITVIGQGVRGTGGNSTVTNKQFGLKSLSVLDLSELLAANAKAILEVDLEGEYRSELVAVGGLSPTELLAKLARAGGLSVTDTGAKLIVRDKFKVLTHTLDKVVSWAIQDKEASSYSVITGSQVRAFPTSIVVPLSTKILAGDFVKFPVVYSDSLTVERVSHDFMRGLTTLDCYVDFEINEKLLVRSSTPVVQTATGSVTAAATAASPTGQAVAVLDPSGATTSRGIPRVKITSTATEAIYYSGQRNKGASSADGPDGGNQACAFSVNKFCLEPVFGRVFGDEPGLITIDGYGQPPTSTSSMLVTGIQASTRKVWGAQTVPVSQAIRGCICICLNSVAGHVGITIEPRSGGDVNSLSNSSSQAAWVAIYMWQAAVQGRYPDIRFDYINCNTMKLA